jgi:hypothetical protein
VLRYKKTRLSQWRASGDRGQGSEKGHAKKGGTFPIESGVPLPQRKRPAKYPLADLDIDQSFFVPATSLEEARKIRCLVANAIQQFEKQTLGQRQFMLRMVDGSFRVWRVA